PRPARWSRQCRPPPPSARWPHSAASRWVASVGSSVVSACRATSSHAPVRRHAEGPHLPASSPSAPPPPSGGIASHDEPAPAQLSVQLAATVSTILDLHAFDVDVDATDAAAVQRHNGLRSSLAYQCERGSSDDAAVLERGDTGWSGLKNGALDAVAMRDIADE